MTTETLSNNAAPIQPEHGFAAPYLAPVATTWPLNWLGWLYFDRRGNGSRPKLLFTVVALDALAIVVSGLMAMALTAKDAAPSASHWWAPVVAVAAIGLLHRTWCYSTRALRHLPQQIVKALGALCIIFVGIGGMSHLAGRNLLAPDTIAAWLCLSSFALVLVRMVMARMISALTSAGRLMRRAVIVGGGRDADVLIEAFAKDDEAHLQILGVFDDRQSDRATLASGPKQLSGTFDDLEAFCLKEGVELAIVTVPTRAEDRLLQVLEKLFTLPVDIRVSARSSRLRLSQHAYTYIGSEPMLAVMDKPLSDWDRVVKNIEDRLLAALLLLLVSPVMMLVALAVRIDSRGPVFFKQRRYGFNNELIEVYKFRSMYAEQSDAAADKLVTKSDPRVTKVGRIIRRTSLDELPQLFNVLKGEMSLVGPRPHATRAKAGGDLYENVVQGYFARHRVKPGVTGWAQINGWRGETDTPEKIERRVAYDLEYIDKWSLPFDLYIIAMTPFALLTDKNAY